MLAGDQLDISSTVSLDAQSVVVRRYLALLQAAGRVAIGLAERLNVVTTYLADLKHQYGDTPGLSMVSDVRSQLGQRQAPSARPGSARDPDPEY